MGVCVLQALCDHIRQTLKDDHARIRVFLA
jgi:hypothetical protein